jgi:hypothetical protein
METGQIYQKIIDIMRDVEVITKDKKNVEQGWNFRGIDDMYNALHPLFKKHGVFITSEVLKELREERLTKNGKTLIWALLDMKFTFYAADGSSVSSIMKGEAMDSADKASNKAESAALKYALMQMFLIPTENMNDADATTPEPILSIYEQKWNEADIVVDALPQEVKEYFRKRLFSRKQAKEFCVQFENNIDVIKNNIID